MGGVGLWHSSNVTDLLILSINDVTLRSEGRVKNGPKTALIIKVRSQIESKVKQEENFLCHFWMKSNGNSLYSTLSFHRYKYCGGDSIIGNLALRSKYFWKTSSSFNFLKRYSRVS